MPAGNERGNCVRGGRVLPARSFWKPKSALKIKFTLKSSGREDRHSPSWNAVCRKESSKRRQRPSAQHWGSPPHHQLTATWSFQTSGEEKRE